ncbi:hypothetical protein EYF80_013804 [Liparis tanakae]|uniref:Uncharacterized protein n=1 Tax=Liparis tanakae TaxID=230148 RepID=A0A4Z2IE58_9TELE|nr:hypothetical protein EYF80_013804 [Liparis tanakae]
MSRVRTAAVTELTRWGGSHHCEREEGGAAAAVVTNISSPEARRSAQEILATPRERFKRALRTGLPLYIRRMAARARAAGSQPFLQEETHT